MPQVDLVNLKVIVVGDRCWGKGDTIGEALKKAEQDGGKQKAYVAYVVHPATTVNEMGGFTWPADESTIEGRQAFLPKEIHRVGRKKK